MIMQNTLLLTNKQYKVTLITNVGFTLISIASFMSVLLTICQIGGDVFDTGDISSIFLGFVAILLALFFVNLDRARKIKTEYFAARELGVVLRNMAISLRDIKEKMDKAEEKHDEITKTNNTLKKSLHQARYLHQHDRLVSNMLTLGIYDEISELDLDALNFAHSQYYKGNSLSDVMNSVCRASRTIRIILKLGWYERYDAGGLGDIADLIITRDIYDYEPDNEPISGAKQSRYGNDANRATPI